MKLLILGVRDKVSVQEKFQKKCLKIGVATNSLDQMWKYKNQMQKEN